MPLGLSGAILEALLFGPEGQDYAAMSIAGIDPIDPGTLLVPERTFQFWPESISDSIDINWSFKDIPGASHSLAQWASNAGRTITFEAPLHRFMKPVDSRNELEKLLDPFDLNTPDAQALKDNRPHNVDVVNEIRFLRGFCYPSYADKDGYTTAFPPPISILYIPGHGLNESGGDAIFAVMTGCDVTYVLAFPDGTPRRATVALTFRQVVQREEGVFFKGWDGPSRYLDPVASSEFEIGGGARRKNEITGEGDVS